MTTKKKNLELIFNVLRETKLSLADSRIRDAFMKQFGEALDDFVKERENVYIKFCDKDEDGNPKVLENKYTFQKSVLEEMSNELEILLNEEVAIAADNTEKIKEFIESTQYNPKPGEVELIDEFLVDLDKQVV